MSSHLFLSMDHILDGFWKPRMVSCEWHPNVVSQKYLPSFYPVIRFYVGVWGSLFSFTTIYPEVVEWPFDRLTVLSNVKGHHNFAYYEAAPRTMYPQRRAFL